MMLSLPFAVLVVAERKIVFLGKKIIDLLCRIFAVLYMIAMVIIIIVDCQHPVSFIKVPSRSSAYHSPADPVKGCSRCQHQQKQ